MQIRSRDFLNPKTIFCHMGTCVSFVILGPVDTSFLHLEKVKILIKKLLKTQSFLSGYWVLVEKIVYFISKINIAKHGSFGVIIRTFPVPVKLKPFSNCSNFCSKIFPFLGRIKSCDLICISLTSQK